MGIPPLELPPLSWQQTNRAGGEAGGAPALPASRPVIDAEFRPVAPPKNPWDVLPDDPDSLEDELLIREHLNDE